MTTLVVLQLVAVFALLVSVAESFRSRPWWPHSPGRPIERGPARGTSPRERRWLHGGLALVLAANVLGAQLDGGTPVAATALGLLVLGAAAIVTGLVRGPAPGELDEFARRYGDEVDAA